MSKATEKKEDLEADVATHSSRLEAVVARSTILDGEISTLQSELSVLSNRQLQMDIMCAVERYVLAKVKADLEQSISGAQKALETPRHYLMNSIDWVQQRLVEQITETPVIPFVEKIVEMLVVKTREKTQQAANTHVQHVVNTVEVETPKIVKEAVHGKKSVIRKKINQFAEHIKNPQSQFSNKVDEMPVAVQRQNPMVQNVQKTKEIPQLRCIDEVVGNPVVQVPRVQVVEKTVEIPQLQTVEKIAETPHTQTIQGTQAPESLGITPVCQVAQTGHVAELVRGLQPRFSLRTRFSSVLENRPSKSLQNPLHPYSSQHPSWKIHPLMSRSTWCTHSRSRVHMPLPLSSILRLCTGLVGIGSWGVGGLLRH